MSPEDFFNVMRLEIEALHKGRISTENFWYIFWKKTGRKIQGDPWEEEYKPIVDREVIKLLLKAKQIVRLVAGTNIIESHYQVLTKIGILSVFDAVYASHKIGLIKPERGFYEFILKKEKVKPIETIFIDDTPANVFEAQRLGITGLLYKNVDDLKNLTTSLTKY